MEHITGIQQVGIGVENISEAKFLYKDLFGMDVLVFDDEAEASLMANYTGNTIHKRKALLTLNMQGGGGFELWQFTSKKTQHSENVLQLGDLGICGVRIKTTDVQKAHAHLSSQKTIFTTALLSSPKNEQHFWAKDQYGNNFNVIESREVFIKTKALCGGVEGVIIGVSDMDKAVNFYKTILGDASLEYDLIGPITDGPDNDSKNENYRRVLLKKQYSTSGAFGIFLGSTSIELIQKLDKAAPRIYENRYWGDAGFIHLCFDVTNMDSLKTICKNCGYHFTVDSQSAFEMEDAAGRFCYVEDPDGTLIELVETHKIPLFKKWGLFINLTKRKTSKPLPKWVIGLLALSKVK